MKFRILMRLVPPFLLTLSALCHVFQTQTLWSYVQESFGSTSLHPKDVRAYTLRQYVQTAKDVRPKRNALEKLLFVLFCRSFQGFWESHIYTEGRPRLIFRILREESKSRK